MDCSPPGSSVHGILQARKLEWEAISFSRGFSHPMDQTRVSCINRSGGTQSTAGQVIVSKRAANISQGSSGPDPQPHGVTALGGSTGSESGARKGGCHCTKPWVLMDARDQERRGSPGREQPQEAADKKSTSGGASCQLHTDCSSLVSSCPLVPHSPPGKDLQCLPQPWQSPATWQGASDPKRQTSQPHPSMGSLSSQARHPCLGGWLRADFPVIALHLAQPLQC